MSKLLLTCTMTMDLNFLLQLSSTWAPKSEELDPKLNNLWYPSAWVKENIYQIFTEEPFVIRSELVLMRYQTGQINNLTGKYIMELSKLKHLQRYMTSFEIYFIIFESQPQSNKLSIIFAPSIELIFGTLETAEIYMNPSHSMIEPIVNRNFGNIFHHQNGPNQHQHTNKNAIQKYNHSITRQQYQYRNAGQQHQHRHHSQQYQPRSFQRHITSSIPYLKENCIEGGLKNRGVRELLMQN